MNKHTELLIGARNRIKDRKNVYVCDAVNMERFERQIPLSMDSEEHRQYNAAGNKICLRIKEILEGEFSFDVWWCNKNPGHWERKDQHRFSKQHEAYLNFFRPMRLDLIDQLMEEFK